MALHAGFAAALSISRSAIQQFLHAAFINDLIKTEFKGQRTLNSTTSPPFPYTLAFDFFMAEPQAILEPNDDNKVSISIELLGTMTFTAAGKPTVTCEVSAKGEMTMPIVMIQDTKTKTIQFGLDPAKALFTTFTSKRTSGTDPQPVYGFDVTSQLQLPIAFAIISSPPDSFLITPPSLDQLMQTNYTLKEPTILITHDSLNIGIDINNPELLPIIITFGDPNALVDLNKVSTDKGWTKTFTENIHTSDDEYGNPNYDTGWTSTTLRPHGVHNSDLAVALNVALLNDVYFRIGRYTVIHEFEKQKFASIEQALNPLKAKEFAKHKTEYDPPTIANTVINKLNATLIDNFIQVDGTASYHGDINIVTDFHLKLLVVRTHVSGSTPFVVQFDNFEGMTGEVIDVQVDTPWFVTLLEVVGAIVGVALAPFTSGISLLLASFMEMLIASFASVELGNAESQLGNGVLSAISGNQGSIGFTLPGTTAPTLELTPNDVVIRPTGISSWFQLTTNAKAASIFMKAHPGSTIWDASDRKAIVVVFDDGGALYNKKDTKVRIRWQVFGDSTANPVIDVDTLVVPSGMMMDPKQVIITHASDELDKYDSFIVKCRVYRPWGNSVQELFAQTLTIKISDRLDRKHKYVHWDHTAYYQGYSAKKNDKKRQGTGWVTADRHSVIHYTDPDKRCKFADQYSSDLQRDDLTYSDALPFDIADIALHRKKVCAYCFFGGPDKHTLK